MKESVPSEAENDLSVAEAANDQTSSRKLYSLSPQDTKAEKETTRLSRGESKQERLLKKEEDINE